MEQHWTPAYCSRFYNPDLKAVMILGFFQQRLESRHQHWIHSRLQKMWDGIWRKHTAHNEFILAELLYLMPCLWRKAVYLTDRNLRKWVFIRRRMTFSWLWRKMSPKKGVSQGIFKILQKHLSGERWCKLFKYKDGWVNNIALLVLWRVQMLPKNVSKLTPRHLKEWNGWTHTPQTTSYRNALYILCPK